MPNTLNSKGFTLIELIIVIALMAILSITAFTNSFSAQKTFAFGSAFKQVLATLQLPRSYSMTQRTVTRPTTTPTKISPLAYGANIDIPNGPITIFGDAPSPSTKIGQYGGPCTGPLYTTCDDTIGAPYTIDSAKYEISFFDNTYPPTTQPDSLTLFYSPPYASFFANTTTGEAVTPISSNDTGYIGVEVSDKNDLNLHRCIIIFTKTGIVEPFDQKNSIMSGLTTPCNP